MEYIMLSDADREQLLLERLRALEADHFRLTLRCQESLAEAEGLKKDLMELERRIELHQATIRAADSGRGDRE